MDGISRQRPSRSFVPGLLLGLLLGAGAGGAVAQETYRLSESDTWEASTGVDPASPEGRLSRVRAALASDRPVRARNLATAWIKAFPNHLLTPEAYMLRGDAHVARGDYYQALFDYEYIARVHPASDAFVQALERELDIASRFAHGTRRKFLGLRLVDAADDAEELLIRIQERLPGSDLAERAALELGDFYFSRWRMELAAEMYSIFLQNYPRSDQVSRARRFLIYSHLATSKGPQFDASGLREARVQLLELIRFEPFAAEQVMAESLVTGIDEAEARKLLVTARWYHRTNDPISAEFTIRHLLERFPRTVAAQEAVRLAEQILPRLPVSVLSDAPDYAALRMMMDAVPRSPARRPSSIRPPEGLLEPLDGDSSTGDESEPGEPESGP